MSFESSLFCRDERFVEILESGWICPGPKTAPYATASGGCR